MLILRTGNIYIGPEKIEFLTDTMINIGLEIYIAVRLLILNTTIS